MTVTDEYLEHNAVYAKDPSSPSSPTPTRGVALITCMDARLDMYSILGMRAGEAHLIRNAGGIVTDDVIRSLAVSQRLLGTREVVLIHHTECGMLTFTDEEFKADLHAETGVEPGWTVASLTDLDSDVRRSVARIKASPFVPHSDSVRGFVLDVATGRLAEVV